ncbi:hypothetical protein [Rhizobium laguerreae]|uniref:hypothetical protein n=1 Tax=Rhizobium laguerreae TaxID=1076926 RepID=UPI001C910E8E|nr:hypothetical protein [Rhizobium laguerreae]MBY3314725.1 hypothetical protein [Rhizobium laguerreae]
MKVIGYARVEVGEDGLDKQEARLKEAGCSEFFSENHVGVGRFAKMVTQGKSTPQIAAAYDVNETAVRRAYGRLGWKVDNRKRGAKAYEIGRPAFSGSVNVSRPPFPIELTLSFR